MSTPTPALDFCQRVRTWQDAEGASSGLPMYIPDGDQETLHAILTAAGRGGPNQVLEDRARLWLIGFRELENQQRTLTESQRTELDDVIARAPYRPSSVRQRRISPRLAYVIIALIIALGASLSIASLLIGNDNGSPPPAGPVAAQPAGPQPGALTDLQQFRADWDVPGSAIADAGSPAALVLLQDGLYYPVLWSIPAGDPGWVTDSTGSITASVHGGDATVTDSGGTTYTVTAGQPFVLASNPRVIFRVLRDGTIQSMPEPHAIRIRVRT